MSLIDRKGRFVLISPVHVANNILKRGYDEKVEITPLKLQKLVYFVYKDYLKKTGYPLFTEPFETWTYGPVIPSIYAEFSSYGKKPIKTFAKDSRGKSFIVTESGAFGNSIDKVWGMYGRLSGETLSKLTHREGTAWTKAKDNKSNYLNIEDIRNEEELFA